jgi:hypothetical protein
LNGTPKKPKSIIENMGFRLKKTKKSSGEAKRVREYDFSGGVRGKYAKRYTQGTNVVYLEPDVAKTFSTTQSVNKALRALVEIIRLQSKTVSA